MAFQIEDEWPFPFCKIFTHSKEMLVFVLRKLEIDDVISA